MNLANILRALLDSVLPRSARRRRSESRALSDISVSPASCNLFGVQISTILDYREPVVAELIQSIKYDRSFRAARLCAEVLADYLREEIASLRTISTRRIFLVPMPLYKERKLERGFNQIDSVLRFLPPEFQGGRLSSIVPALSRIRPTKQQTQLSREERLRNVAGAFELVDHALIEHAHVFLIDDVVTTGATLSEAAKPLAPYCASLSLLALARA